MAKVPAITFLLLRKRAYGVGVENVRLQFAGASEMKINKGDNELSVERKKEVFWMRDPKTGNWIPETRFNEVDVAELRNKFLPKQT